MSDEKQNAGLPVSPSVTPVGSQGTGSRGRKIYVASSWRNPIQQDIVAALRSAGHECYDFRNPAPGNNGFAWGEVNKDWLRWSPEQFARDLYSGHPSIVRGFAFDKNALDWADTCVLVLPCGRSAHLEAGYAAGQGKRTIFFLHPDRFEPELMYLLGHDCVTTVPGLLASVVSSDYGPVRWLAEGAGEGAPAIQSPTPQQESKKGTEGGQKSE